VVAINYAVGKMQAPSEQLLMSDTSEIVTLPNGSTMLVEHGSMSRRVIDWMKAGRSREQAIHVGNENFAAGSATLSRDGWEHLVEFARMLKAYHGVKTLILFSPYHGKSSTLPIEHLRANRIHDELLNQGVAEQQVTVSQQAFEAGEDPAEEEGLKVLLVKREGASS